MFDQTHKIRISFNKAEKTYNEYSGLQKSVCTQLINYLPLTLSKDACVVDLGCGTGISTALLYERFSTSRMYGVDAASQLLNQAKIAIGDHVQLILSDFDYPVFLDDTIDLIFSNMSLQWSINFKNTISNLSKQLKANALIAFSVPIKGTFIEIAESHRNNFFSMDEIVMVVTQSNFEILSLHVEKKVENFSTLRDLLLSIKKIGANTILKKTHRPNSSLTKKIDHIFISGEGERFLTYQIGYLIAKKKT